MYNYYNTLNHNLKRGILKFSEKISKKFFKTRVQIRFTDDFRHIKQSKLYAFGNRQKIRRNDYA